MRHFIAVTGLLVLSLLLHAGCDTTGSGGCEGSSPCGGPEPSILPIYFDHPAWHPEGTWIAVEHGDSVDTNGDGSIDTPFAGIWLVHAETGHKQPLIAGFGAPDWSADGRKLALNRNGQIFTVEVTSLNPARVDTSSLRKLTNKGRNFFPDWSPDGKWIAYDSNLNDPNGAYAIWRMRSNGTEKRKVIEGRSPDWSIDGDYILFSGLYSEVYEVSAQNASGVKQITKLNQGNTTVYDKPTPKYSPNGTKIAFTAETSTGHTVISIINRNGTDQRQLISQYAFRFDWSPDGKHLVFVRWGVNEDHWFPGSGQLWIIRADGTELRQLTHFQAHERSK